MDKQYLHCSPANVSLARPKRQTQHKSPRVETQRCQVDLQETRDQFDLEKNNQPRRSEINNKEKVHPSKTANYPRTHIQKNGQLKIKQGDK